MKRFKFKLENVLEYRVTLETLAKNAYQEALRILNIERDNLLHLFNLRKELMNSYNIKAGEVVQPETLMFLSRYTVQLVHLIDRQTLVVTEKEEISK